MPLHLYPGDMDKYAERLDDEATNTGKAKTRPDDEETTRMNHDRAVYLRKLWRARRDSNPQPFDP